MKKNHALLTVLALVAGAAILFNSSKLDFASASKKSTSNGVVFATQRLSDYQINALYGGQGKHLLKGKNPIVPVKVSLANNTSKPQVVKIGKAAVSDLNVIRKRIEKNVALITTASTVGGLLLAGPIGAIAFGAGFGTDNANKNKYMIKELEQEALFASEVIPAKSSMSKLVFVPRANLDKPIIEIKTA